jgi:hypothetical protein
MSGERDPLVSSYFGAIAIVNSRTHFVSIVVCYVKSMFGKLSSANPHVKKIEDILFNGTA